MVPMPVSRRKANDVMGCAPDPSVAVTEGEASSVGSTHNVVVTFADVYTGPNIIAPLISVQPTNTLAVEGGAATFIAAASGTAPLHFQ